MDQTEEIKQLIENASHGYWVPLGIVATCFSVIIVLLIYIWNVMLKQNQERHTSHEEHNAKQDQMLEQMKETTNSLRILVTEIKTKQDLTFKRS